jgi:hypothetical protein
MLETQEKGNGSHYYWWLTDKSYSDYGSISDTYGSKQSNSPLQTWKNEDESFSYW